MKSKITKYKVVKTCIGNKDACNYKIMFRSRSLFQEGKLKFPHWAALHEVFHTEADAIEEVKNYIKFDNED